MILYFNQGVIIVYYILIKIHIKALYFNCFETYFTLRELMLNFINYYTGNLFIESLILKH